MIKRIVCYGFFVALMGVIFSGFITGDSVLLTTDAAIKGSNVSLSDVVFRMVPHWSDQTLLGAPRGTGIQLPTLLKACASGIVWNNLAYGLACLLASFFFLRLFRWMTPWAAVLGAIAAFWVGTNFSIMIAGHYFKPYVVLFFICALIPVGAVAAGSVVSALIWGACVGLMFVQQPDVALFFALFAGAYLVFRLWKAQGFRPLRWLRLMLPAAAVALLFAAGPLLNGYKYHVKGAAQMQTPDKKAKWDYVTQWSVPPNEVIDFVAPGYYGWRSGEPEGPYWGRTGRSADWENTKQGFRNFKMESTYIGIIPVGFAIFALFACRGSKHRAEILFWAGAAVVALLLAFGRYFPLYSLFYKLPVVNNIRNPNKFIQVFQVCLAVLSAYGFDALWRSREDGGSNRGQNRPLRAFFWSSLGALVIFGMWALVAVLGQKGGVEQFVSQGWSPADAQTMVQNRAGALLQAVLMSGVMVAVFAMFSFLKPATAVRWRSVVGVLLVLLVAGDAVKLSKHYIKEMPRSYVEANVLTDFLHANLGDQRVALLTQDGINNIWITYLFPYNNILCFNYTDMPRMAKDYKALLMAGQRNPLNMWRFSGVKYVLAPSSMETQLAPAGCQKVFSYGVSGAGGQEFKVISHPNGPFSVYELKGWRRRYALLFNSEKVSDDRALAAAFSSPNKVYLPEDSALSVLNDSGGVGTVDVLESHPGKASLKVSAKKASILRVAEKYDPDWKATVDGKKVPVERVDFICQGISIPAGEHEVVLRYAPSRLYFNLQLLGGVIVIGALVLAFWERKKIDVAD